LPYSGGQAPEMALVTDRNPPKSRSREKKRITPSFFLKEVLWNEYRESKYENGVIAFIFILKRIRDQGNDPKQFVFQRNRRFEHLPQSLLPADEPRESCQKAFPSDKMVSGILDSEMIGDTAKIVNEAQKDKVQVYLIINNRAGGNAPQIAQKIAERFHSQKQQRLF
jgi:hypothetical protein